MPRKTRPLPVRTRLLDAALELIRARGFSATSVDDLCRAAGVTKGAFFHHFASKEALGVAAAHHWSQTTGALFADAPYHAPPRAIDRLLAYIDFRKALVDGDVARFSCLAGTMIQEMYDASPTIRQACGDSICSHAATLEADIAEACAELGPGAAQVPPGLALHLQAVLQGAFIVAKAADDKTAALASLDHLRRYVELLFQTRGTQGAPS